MTEFSKSQKYFEYASKNLRPSILIRDQNAEFPREIFEEVTKLGIFAVVDNSFQETLRYQAHCLFNLARGSLDIPFSFTFVAQGLTIHLLEKFGSITQKTMYLADLKSGKKIGAICNAEEGVGTNILQIKTVAELNGTSKVLLNGKKSIATNIPLADLLLVSAKTVESATVKNIEVFIVPDFANVLVSEHDHSFGMRTGKIGPCSFEGKELSYPDSRLGHKSSGVELFKECFLIERIHVCMVVAGVLTGLIDVCMEEIQKHELKTPGFGKNQYIQEKVFKIFKVAETIRSLVCEALSHEDYYSSEVSRILALAKYYASEDAFQAIAEFMEMHGGVAYYENHLARKTMQDICALKFLGGTKELQKNVVFNEIKKSYEEKQNLIHSEKNKKAEKAA